MKTISQLYDEQIALGLVREDDAQRAAIVLLDELLVQKTASKKSFLSRIFGSAQRVENHVCGVYLHGEVGRGKSFLMDLFVEVASSNVRRVHFHELMKQVHEELNVVRQKMLAGQLAEGDPVPHVVATLFDGLQFLCLDEFMVLDIADAMILGRLLKGLFGMGTRLIVTSNVMPKMLYKDGINRDLFLPTIDLLQTQMRVFELVAQKDYRLGKGVHKPYWLLNADEKAKDIFEQSFLEHIDGVKPKPRTLNVFGRKWDIPIWAQGVGKMSFSELCESAMGANDYLVLAKNVHTLYLDGVPHFDESRRQSAKRFITLIDALYDGRVNLVAMANAPIGRLFALHSGDEAFASLRTVSRLIEMGSQDYQSQNIGDVDKMRFIAQSGVAHT